MVVKKNSRMGYVLAGRYEIIRQIGEGGMSIVYLAMDDTLHKQWAVKEFKQTGARVKDEQFRKNLIAEAELMKNLDNPALPRIVDIIEADNTVFIVMDYIEGQDLGSLVRNSKRLLSEEEVIDLGLQLCSVLDYLHTPDSRKGKPVIVYRDLKPDNIIVNDRGMARLIDFGIARKFDEEKSSDTVVMGTKGFMAPEQLSTTLQTDPRADIYALGITMHYLLTGQNPDERTSVLPIREYNPQLSEGLEAIIAKCVQPDRENRYQSCREIAYDLEHYTELTKEYRAVQEKKITTFKRLAIATLSCFVAGIICFIVSAALKGSTYDAQIAEALSITLDAGTTPEDENYKQKEAAYLSAINTDDSRIEAYQSLLDDALSPAESEQFYDLLNDRASHCNASDYASLCYDYADKLFFYKSDYGQAKKWYEEAVVTNALDSALVTTAQTYISICDFSENLSRKEGSDSISENRNYAEYWDNLCKRFDAVDSEESTTFSKIKLYELMVDALTGPVFVQEFKNADISQQDLNDRVDQIKAKANSLANSKLNYTQENLCLDVVNRCEIARGVINRIYMSVIDTAHVSSEVSENQGSDA